MDGSQCSYETGLPYAQADLIDHKRKRMFHWPIKSQKMVKATMSDDAFLTAPVETYSTTNGIDIQYGAMWRNDPGWLPPKAAAGMTSRRNAGSKPRRQLYQTPDPQVGFR